MAKLDFKTRLGLWGALSLGLALVFLGTIAQAQVATANRSGTVEDRSRAAVPGANVALQDQTGVSKPESAMPAPECQLIGVVLTSGHLRARIVNNASRICSLSDTIYTPAGLNYETSRTTPRAGQQKNAWNAPRVAPMTMEQVDAHTVRLTQKTAEAAGLNEEAVFHLGDTYAYQTITVWPDGDIESSNMMWASYMNLVQNTSLYLRGVLQGDERKKARWLEMTSAGHYGTGSGTFFRPGDPTGKAWQDFLADNPVLRQAIVQRPESLEATERAGFKLGEIASFDNFFFGFVDNYVTLWIFRKPENGSFHPWVSASGAEALRRPAWDFGIESGPQKAGERRTYYVRFVYKPFAGMDDVLKEVARFQASEK